MPNQKLCSKAFLVNVFTTALAMEIEKRMPKWEKAQPPLEYSHTQDTCEEV